MRRAKPQLKTSREPTSRTTSTIIYLRESEATKRSTKPSLNIINNFLFASLLSSLSLAIYFATYTIAIAS